MPRAVTTARTSSTKSSTRPEGGVGVRQVGAAPAAELVVVDDRPAVPGEVGHRQAVVVRHARAAVEHDQGRLRRLRVELAGDAVPRLVSTEVDRAGAARLGKAGLCRGHGHPFAVGIGIGAQ